MSGSGISSNAWMRGSGISDISDSLRSAVSTRVRTGVSSSSAILVTRELFSLLSILVRISEMFMTAGLPKRGVGRKNRAPGQCGEQQKQFGLVNARHHPPNGPNGSEKTAETVQNGSPLYLILGGIFMGLGIIAM